MLLVDDTDDTSLRLIDALRVGVIIVETALFSGEGTPFIVIARLNLLPNLEIKHIQCVHL